MRTSALMVEKIGQSGPARLRRQAGRSSSMKFCRENCKHFFGSAE